MPFRFGIGGPFAGTAALIHVMGARLLEKFYLGHREYDPEKLGYRYDKFANGFEFDTRPRGNSNRGHEFNDDKNAHGRVGPALSPGDRKALIEYLKTL